LIVELKADGTRFRARRVARMLGGDLPVEADANGGIAGFDLHAVPFARALDAVLGGCERVDASARVGLPIVIDDLDFVADVGGRDLRKCGELRPL